MRHHIRKKKDGRFVAGFRNLEDALTAFEEYDKDKFYICSQETVKEKDYIFPVIRDFDRAMDKLYFLKESTRCSPMQYVNWFCSFCCPHLKAGTTGITCKRDTCIFGRLRRKFFELNPEYEQNAKNNTPDFS